MSVFNRGGKSESKTESSNVNEATNLNLQDTSGTTVGLSKVDGSVTVTTLDGGAINLALTAVERAADTFQEGLSFAEETQEMAFGSVDRAFEGALDFSGVVVDRSLDAIGSSYNRALDAVDDAFGRALDSSDQSREDTQSITRSALGTVQEIARQQAASGDQRIQEISRTAIYAVVAAVAVVGLVIAFRR